MTSQNKLRALTAAMLACCALSAQAAVTMPGGDIFLTGELDDIKYGSAGNVDGAALLYISQLGGTLKPNDQVQGVPELSYSYSISGLGTNLLTAEYRIANAGSSIKTWTDLRFAFLAQPDGDPVNFIDSVTETWGAKQVGDPDKRQSQSWDGTAEGSLIDIWRKANGGPGADGAAVAVGCTAGCDAELGLQWNLATLNPGDTFVIRVGLSDNGQHLSSRYFTTTGAGFNESLTLSGVASVVSVPEAQTWAMLFAGLGVLGAVSRRRRQL